VPTFLAALVQCFHWEVPIPPGQSKAPPLDIEDDAELVLIATLRLNPLPARLPPATSLSPRFNVGVHVATRLSPVNRGGSNGRASGPKPSYHR